MFDRFTDRAREVVGLAKRNAQRLNHAFIDTEHLLLGLVEEGSGAAVHVLMRMEFELTALRTKLEEIVQVGGTPVTNANLPFTPRTRMVFELAVEEASNLGHDYIGTEHLLLGLIREDEGLAARVLQRLGVTFDETRDELLEFLRAVPRFKP